MRLFNSAGAIYHPLMLIIRTLSLAGIFCASLAFLGGCTAPHVGGPTTATFEIADRDTFVNRTLTMLRENDLPPRFVDREIGRIETRRSTGGQWFEIWRSDVIGGYQSLESTLHTIGRTATITLDPVDGADQQTLVTVDVRKERYSAPERQVTTASGALGIYSETVPTYAGNRGRAGRFETWVPLGRDPLLEQRLLEELSALASRVTAAPAPQMQNRPAPRQRTAPPQPRPAPVVRPQPTGDALIRIEPA